MCRDAMGPFIQKAFEVLHDGKSLDLNWHIEAMCYQLDRCARGDITRSIFALQPRSLKSECTSVAFPLWLLGRDPSINTKCISYGEDLSRHFAQLRRKLAESDWYQNLYPDLKITKCTDTVIKTDAGGEIQATSIGGAITGLGADYIVIDDAMKAGDAPSKVERRNVIDWFRNTLYSRLDDKETGVIIIVGQRTHEDDLIGNVLELDNWVSLVIPAIATENDKIPISDDETYFRAKGEPLNAARESLDSLAQTKNILGSYNFAAQYMQAPIPPEGNLFQRKWFKTYRRRRSREPFDRVVQSWDTAAGTNAQSSYSACLTWGVVGSDYYLLEVFREQIEFPELLHAVRSQRKRHRPSAILIEAASSGKALIQTLNQSNFHTIPCRPDKDKVTRAAKVSATVESGRVFIPQEAPWLADFLSEILGFPNSRNNDQVDAFSQFLNWATERETASKLDCRVYHIGDGISEVTAHDNYYDRVGTERIF